MENLNQNTLRDVSDHVNDSIRRLSGVAELFELIGRHPEELIQYKSFITSLIDVYSRDAVNCFSNLLDEKRGTSSMFRLVEAVEDDVLRKQFLTKIKDLKKTAKDLLIVRGGKIGHFSIKANTFKNNSLPVNVDIQLDPNYITSRLEKLEAIYWELKEILGIDGVFMVWTGNPVEEFKKMIQNLRGQD